jgi:hypothetical protein
MKPHRTFFVRVVQYNVLFKENGCFMQLSGIAVLRPRGEKLVQLE